MLDPKHVAEIVKSNADYLAHNAELIDIFEGNLCEYVDRDLKAQLSLQTYNQSKFRNSPINVLPKVIDKLTNIYQTSVTREVLDGTESDQELMEWYAQKMQVNEQMNSGNEMFNLNKACLLQPYVNNLQPGLRVILNDRFIAYSDDPVYLNKPTYIILICGTIKGKVVYHTYSETEFMVSNQDGERLSDVMNQIGNAEGINPIGKMPFVYVNESKYRVQPKLDTDTLRIVKLLPVMLTDLNIAAMFQSFSVMYGINVDDENLVMAPNAFWRFKSDPTSDVKPEIGQIKPQVDYTQVLGLIQSQLSMWLGTKGIRASSIGSIDAENFASGISKVIDEMDTYEARQKQIGYFENAESELWDLLLKSIHPYWSGLNLIENKAKFTATAEVLTKFSVQLPLQTRGQVVKDVKEEYSAGFISRRRALIKLNPELTESEIEDLMEEIDEERGITEVIPQEEPKVPEETQAPADETGAA